MCKMLVFFREELKVGENVYSSINGLQTMVMLSLFFSTTKN